MLIQKLKSAVKNGTEVTLNFFWHDADDSNDEINFPLFKYILVN